MWLKSEKRFSECLVKNKWASSSVVEECFSCVWWHKSARQQVLHQNFLSSTLGNSALLSSESSPLVVAATPLLLPFSALTSLRREAGEETANWSITFPFLKLFHPTCLPSNTIHWFYVFSSTHNITSHFHESPRFFSNPLDCPTIPSVLSVTAQSAATADYQEDSIITIAICVAQL